MSNLGAELKEVLIFAAENGYAKEGVKKTKEADGSDTIELVYGDWRIHDNYFTSEDGRRYHGRMVAFLSEKAMWFCGYSGFVSEQADPGEVYSFLKKAMLQPEPDFPVRGPWDFVEDQWTYHYAKTEPESTLNKFETRETISEDGQQVYEAIFYGGKVN